MVVNLVNFFPLTFSLNLLPQSDDASVTLARHFSAVVSLSWVLHPQEILCTAPLPPLSFPSNTHHLIFTPPIMFGEYWKLLFRSSVHDGT